MAQHVWSKADKNYVKIDRRDEGEAFDPTVNAEERRQNHFALDVEAVFARAEKLLLDKHKAYGAKNISAAPGGALNGLRVRLHDKFARLNHMLDNDVEDAVGESLVETLTDALNYCAIAILVLEDKWPTE